MPHKSALITGITGQDGSYLASCLLKKGYIVHGMKRRASQLNTQRVDHFYQDPHERDRNFILHYGDMTDASNLLRIVQEVQPDEIYNLAAQPHVKVSFESPEYTANSDAIGPLRILEAIRILGLGTKTRFYQASTSEMYGKVVEDPQTEKTPFYPRSPYGVAKLYAYWITKNYREAYGMFACNGIAFNHESPLRGETFVTRKITRAAARIRLGLEECLFLGNMNAKRDWGHSAEYAEGMWKILNADTADDYVLATGRTTTVREFARMAFAFAGIELEFSGSDDNEIARCKHSGRVVVRIDKAYFRPTEVDVLRGKPDKAKQELDWSPTIDVERLCQEMVEADLYRAHQEANTGRASKALVEALVHRPGGFLGWMVENDVESYANLETGLNPSLGLLKSSTPHSPCPPPKSPLNSPRP